jgi:hypothetical protein
MQRIPLTPQRLAVMRTLRADAATAEVLKAFRMADIEPILLKGPTTAQWLYEDRELRDYVDADLLVAPESFGRAERVLGSLEFSRVTDDRNNPARVRHANLWRRGAEGAQIDLHRSLPGVRVAPEEFWAIVRPDAHPIELTGMRTLCLSPAARAMHLALHVTHHGDQTSKPIADLERALEVLDQATWRDAAELAERLGALPEFVAGLRLRPRGGDLVAEMGLDRIGSVRATLAAATPPPVALSIVDLLERRGIGGKLALLARKLLPTPYYMRVWSPLARRGRLGLALAYGWRPIWLLARTGPAVFALARARRELEHSTRSQP